MSDSTVLLLIFFLMSAGFLGIGIQMNRWLARPRTLNDDYCSAVDIAIDRDLAEQRRRVERAHRVALDEERRGLVIDLAGAAEMAQMEGEFVREIEAWMASREWTA